MTDTWRSDSTQRLLNIHMFVDGVCDDFEKQLRQGRAPRIEDYIQELSEPHRSLVFRELLCIEVELLREKNTLPAVEEYRKRFPAFALDVDTAYAALKETPCAQPSTPISITILGNKLCTSHIIDGSTLRHYAEKLASRGRRTAGLFARVLVEDGLLSPDQAACILHGDIDSLQIGHYRLLDKLGEGAMGSV